MVELEKVAKGSTALDVACSLLEAAVRGGPTRHAAASVASALFHCCMGVSEPALQVEVEARLNAIKPVIAENVAAAAEKRPTEVSGGCRAIRNLATHDFSQGSLEALHSPRLAKRRQRRRKHAYCKEHFDIASTASDEAGIDPGHEVSSVASQTTRFDITGAADGETQPESSFPPSCTVVSGWGPPPDVWHASIVSTQHVGMPHASDDAALASSTCFTENCTDGPPSNLGAADGTASDISHDNSEYVHGTCSDRAASMQVDWLQPDAWLSAKWAEWQTTLQSWKAKQKAWKVKQREPYTDVAGKGSAEIFFSKFCYEDWALLNIRVELHLLTHARPTVALSQLPFYYNEAFKKPFTLSQYGFNELRDLAALIHDTVAFVDVRQVLVPQLGVHTDFGHFARLTDAQGRDRRRRIDDGDHTAILKFR